MGARLLQHRLCKLPAPPAARRAIPIRNGDPGTAGPRAAPPVEGGRRADPPDMVLGRFFRRARLSQRRRRRRRRGQSAPASDALLQTNRPFPPAHFSH